MTQPSSPPRAPRRALRLVAAAQANGLFTAPRNGAGGSDPSADHRITG